MGFGDFVTINSLSFCLKSIPKKINKKNTTLNLSKNSKNQGFGSPPQAKILRFWGIHGLNPPLLAHILEQGGALIREMTKIRPKAEIFWKLKPEIVKNAIFKAVLEHIFWLRRLFPP